jgi:hypothetical protein
LDEKTEKFYKDLLPKIISSIIKGDDKKGNNRLKADKDKIEEVFVHLKKYMDIMRKAKAKGKKNLKQKEDDVLDRFNIATALCCAVLKAGPIVFKKKSDTPQTPTEESANELSAFLLGLQAIQNDWNAKPKGKTVSNKKIEGPKPTDLDTTYQDWFVKLFKEGAFAHFDYEDKLFEETLLFFISHIYFLIESYSFQYYLKRGGK